MTQPAYNFPKSGGGSIKKTLALPTNERITEFLLLIPKAKSQVDLAALVRDINAIKASVQATGADNPDVDLIVRKLNTTEVLLERLVSPHQSFAELLTNDGQVSCGLFLLDLALSKDQIKKVLDVCLEERSDEIDFDTPNVLDLRTVDEAVQDFFDQRAATFTKRREGLRKN